MSRSISSSAAPLATSSNTPMNIKVVNISSTTQASNQISDGAQTRAQELRE